MGGLVCYHSQVNGLTAFSVRGAGLRRLPRRVRRRRHRVGFPGRVRKCRDCAGGNRMRGSRRFAA